MSRNLIGSLLILFLFSAFAAMRSAAYEQSSPMRRVFTVALMRAELPEDVKVRQEVDKQRKLRITRARKSGLFQWRVAPIDNASRPLTSKKSYKAISEQESELTDKQWEQVTQTLFEDALFVGLQSDPNLKTIPEIETEAARKDLLQNKPTSSAVLNKETLMNRLKCNALLSPHALKIEIRNGIFREVCFWGEVQTSILNKEHSGNSLPDSKRAPKIRSVECLPERVLASGSSIIVKSPFQSKYLKSISLQFQEAVTQAGNAAAYQLSKGEQVPFMNRHERVAILPTISQERADALVFSSSGKQVIPSAVQELPTDLSSMFKPNVLPLSGEALCNPHELEKAMKRLGIANAQLWKQGETPDVEKIQALGRLTRSDYVMIAKVSDIELSSAPAVPKESGNSRVNSDTMNSQRSLIVPPLTANREARAVAIGALVRVDDGEILWFERTTATMNAHDVKVTGIADFSTSKRLVNDVSRFSLLQLQRRFALYRRQFTM